MTKVGDRVSHVYNGKLVGVIIKLTETPGTEHFAGGTSAKKFFATVKLDNSEETFTIDINDLMRE